MSYRNNIEQQNLLNQFLRENGVELPGETLGKLYDYADLVVETKEFGNLIAAKDSEKILSRHIADSRGAYIYIVRECKEIPAFAGMTSHAQKTTTSAHPYLKATEGSDLIPHTYKWADMGAGAGCPVFPLAIVMP